MSNKFLKLPDRVAEVKTRFEAASKAVGANFDTKIESLKKDISNLEAEITKYHGIARLHLHISIYLTDDALFNFSRPKLPWRLHLATRD